MRTGSSNREALRKALRDAGLKVTTPRIEVLDLMSRASLPLSHGDVHARLSGRELDRATVYRNLMDLTNAGLLRRKDLGDHVWRFERTTEAKHPSKRTHPHFVCSACGIVACLPARSVRLKETTGAMGALRRGQVEIQLRGVCDACA